MKNQHKTSPKVGSLKNETMNDSTFERNDSQHLPNLGGKRCIFLTKIRYIYRTCGHGKEIITYGLIHY